MTGVRDDDEIKGDYFDLVKQLVAEHTSSSRVVDINFSVENAAITVLHAGGLSSRYIWIELLAICWEFDQETRRDTVEYHGKLIMYDAQYVSNDKLSERGKAFFAACRAAHGEVSSLPSTPTRYTFDDIP